MNNIPEELMYKLNRSFWLGLAAQDKILEANISTTILSLYRKLK